MGKILDKETILQIPVLYEECKNKSEVARRLGIAVTTVSRYLKLYEENGEEFIDFKKERKPPIKIDEEMEKKINELYAVTKNMSEVARQFNTTPSTIKNHLNEENLAHVKKQYEDRDALFFYIVRLFGPESEEQPVSNWNLTQMNKFKQQGMPYQGQLLTLKYFYEVQHHKVTDEYHTIGIIPHMYEQAKQYYLARADKAAEINRAISKQLEQDRIELKYNPSDYFGRKKKKKNQKLIDLESLKE